MTGNEQHFDDDRRPVPVVMPDVFFDDEPEAELPAADLETALANFLGMLAGIGDAHRTGQTVIVLAYLAGMTPFKTKAQLARRLKVSPGRVSQILQAIPSEFQSLRNLKSRNR